MRVNIIIAGAQKCGTTALHHFLSKHPKVIGSNPKEVDFFNSETNYKKGIRYYHRFFSHKPNFASLRGYSFMDASPSYTVGTTEKRIERTAQRIFSYNNNAKIIILVRNPVERAYSAWKMYRARFNDGNKDWWMDWWLKMGASVPDALIRRKEEEFNDFELYAQNEIKAEREGKMINLKILDIGHYSICISVFQKIFPENLIVLKNENLNNNTPAELEKISNFLTLGKFNWSNFKGIKIFEGSNKEKPSASAINLLNEYYRDSNQKLNRITGIDYLTEL